MTQPLDDEQARTHVNSRASAITGKIKETDHVKRVVAVGAALLFVVVLVIILHGPNKKHHTEDKPANKVEEPATTFDLKAYQQQVAEAERQRAQKQEQQAIKEANEPEGHTTGGIVRPSEGDDDADIGYVKQEWKQPMIWDVPEQNGGAASSAQASAKPVDPNQQRIEMIRRAQEDRMRENSLHEQRLREHLEQLKKQQAAIFHQREAAQ